MLIARFFRIMSTSGQAKGAKAELAVVKINITEASTRVVVLNLLVAKYATIFITSSWATPTMALTICHFAVNTLQLCLRNNHNRAYQAA